MVPLRIERCNEGGGWERAETRPRLVLQDTTRPASAESHVLPSPRPARRHREAARREALLFTVAASVVVLFFAGCLLSSLWHVAQDSYASSTAAQAPTLTVTVAPGDTLWHYAARYGAPDRYILDRVESIARANGISSDTPLVPGQHLRIAVSNPVVLAALQRQHHVKVAFR